MPRLAPISCAAALTLAGCGAPADSAADSASGPEAVAQEGVLQVSLAILDDTADNMAEPPTGTFYGGIYLEQYVTSTGLTDDAVALETFEVDVALDPAGSRTEVVYETGPLPVGLVYIIGFLDSDASSPDNPDAEQGDPVTLPGYDDRYEVIGGEASPAEILLDLLFP